MGFEFVKLYFFFFYKNIFCRQFTGDINADLNFDKIASIEIK